MTKDLKRGKARLRNGGYVMEEKNTVTGNSETMIDYVKDKQTINNLRGMGQLISKSSADFTRNHLSDCFLCGKTIDESNCIDSHLIPESFLRLISAEGKVSTIDAITSLQSRDPANFFDSKVSTKSANTFLGICRSCDNSRFQEYENNPNSDLTQNKMREIALKTLLGFRYFNIYKVYQSGHNAELAKSLIERELSDKYTIEEIEIAKSSHGSVVMHNSLYGNTVPKIDSAEYEANVIKDGMRNFSRILDFEVNSKPVIAVQSFCVFGCVMIYVNIFPTVTGNRVIVFRSNVKGSIEDEQKVSKLSPIELLACSLINFRRGICIDPKTSSTFVDGYSIYEILGPRSLQLQSLEDLKCVPINHLMAELKLDHAALSQKIRTYFRMR